MSFVYQILGLLLILAGLPLFWTPIPIGLIMIAAGLALLISNSDAAREFVRARRARHPRFNAWVIKAEGVVPHPFDRILKRTDVDQPDSADQE